MIDPIGLRIFKKNGTLTEAVKCFVLYLAEASNFNFVKLRSKSMSISIDFFFFIFKKSFWVNKCQQRIL